MAIPISYNIRNVIHRPVATLTTAVGIGLTVAILIGALALASGFQAALRTTGSANNAIALRKGADSELSSGVGRETSEIIRARPDVATGPDGRPLASSDVVVLTYLPRIGQPGGSNVTVRGIDPSSLALRSGGFCALSRSYSAKPRTLTSAHSPCEARWNQPTESTLVNWVTSGSDPLR